MTRPNIIRADTIDLQEHDHPSAKDHSNQPQHPAPLGAGPAAPHQNSALRHVNEERSAEQDYLADIYGSQLSSQHTSERTSHEGSELLEEDAGGYLDQGNENNEMQLDEQSIQQNGVDDQEGGDGNADDSMDDDMIDKVSSSPSIDDGAYIFHFKWPERNSSLRAMQLPSSLQQPIESDSMSRDTNVYPSAGWSLEHSQHRITPTSPSPSEVHHLSGEYIRSSYTKGLNEFPEDEAIDIGSEQSSLQDYLLPVLDPALDNVLASPRSQMTCSSPEMDLEEDDEDSSLGGDGDSSKDDDTDDIFLSPNLRFVDSGWGGECLRDTEDIDFEFVYALHTFVATVEGQANATKGDTMVLLDDSNSYWWLVRVVKDSSIGYLPAEHIETPTERLARLNKHRNIDLSQSMLGDNPEKSKNPLKKAMRRRNAKMVQFTTPTYFEPSEVDYSDTENEQMDSEEMNADNQDGRAEQNQNSQESQDSIESVKTPEQSSASEASDQVQRGETSDQPASSFLENDMSNGDGSSEDLMPRRTQNGTIRNTDSFFKDDKTETRKISLTPNLLRDDSNGGSSKSSDTKEKSPGGSQDSIEQLDKLSPTSDKFAKEDKKKKDKRPGMLSGLFKKKDKKLKVDEAAGGTVRKEEGLGLPTVMPPDDNAPASPTATSTPQSPTSQQPTSQPKRGISGGKLTKPPPQTASGSNNKGLNGQPLTTSQANPQTTSTEQQINSTTSESAIAARRNADTERSVGSQPLSVQIPESIQESPTETSQSEPRKEGGVLSPLTNLLSPSDQPKKERLKKAKQRMELDVDSSPDMENPSSSSFSDPSAQSSGISSATDTTENQERDGAAAVERSLNEPTQVTTEHSESQDERSDSPVSPSTPTEDSARSFIPSSSTEPPSAFSAVTAKEYFSTPTASSTTTPVPETPPQMNSEEDHWDDAALRSYLDNEHTNDVKDLLLLVNDNTGVVPVGKDHPIMMELGFHKHQKQLDEMSSQLDKMLTDWLAEKRAASKQRALSR